MGKHHNYLETSIWYKEEISDPYQVIAEFFGYDDIAGSRDMNKDILLAAFSKRYTRDVPRLT